MAAKKMGMDPSTYEVQTVDLASLDNVRQFVNAYKASGKPADALICNAAVWYPRDKEPRLTPDGYEEVRITSVQKVAYRHKMHAPKSWHTLIVALALLCGIQEVLCPSLMPELK
jgi:hypothetical protein